MRTTAESTRGGGEVDGQHVGLDHLEPLVAAQPGGEIAIELDHGQVPAALQQWLRHRAEARPDLDQRLPRPRIDRRDDRLDDRAVGQEVLPETLAGDVAHAARTAYSGASRISM
jgi:hypothetical protein